VADEGDQFSTTLLVVALTYLGWMSVNDSILRAPSRQTAYETTNYLRSVSPTNSIIVNDKLSPKELEKPC
jgi:hypothetical protein